MSNIEDTPPPPSAPPPNGGPPSAAGAAPLYPARLEVAYPDRLNRVTTAFRVVLVIPIVIVIGVLTASTTSADVSGGLFAATLLLILFRKRYPRWWFDFAVELARFTTRIVAYLALLTDKYPSTVEHQAVALDLDYPDVERDLNRGLPLVKWFLAIPHYIVLVFLGLGAVIAVIVAWFAILFTGRYPRSLFDYVVGVARWGLRVQAYAFLLLTDRYPPFSLR
jgi:Domain of unknown function (DUF4389)